MASPTDPNAAPPNRSLVSRLLGGPRALLTWIRQKPLFRGSLVAIIPFVLVTAGIGLWYGIMGQRLTPEEKLTLALERLDEGDFSTARLFAAELRTDPTLTDAQLAGPMFVLGAVMKHDADEYPDPRQREILYRVAARYFEEARNRGLPPDRESEGLYLFGYSLLQAGRYAYAAEALRDALTVDPQPRKTELHQLLAIAYLRQTPPSTAKAVDEIQSYLADKKLTPRERDMGLLWLARTHLQHKDLPACRQALEQLTENTPLRNERLLLLGELLLREGDTVLKGNQVVSASSPSGQKYTEALDNLRQVQRSVDGNDALVPQSMLFQAEGLERLDEDGEAEQMLVRVRQQYFGSPEALAAAVRLGSLLVRQGRAVEGLPLLRRACADVTDPAAYDNPWMPREEFERRLQMAYSKVLADGQFESAIEFTQAWDPFVPLHVSVEARGLARRKWAQHLEAEANGKPEVEKEVELALARDQYRLEGSDFDQLAQLRLSTSKYPEDLWASAEAYFRGHAFRSSARQCRIFLRSNPASKRPDALATLGECLLSMGKFQESVEVFKLCLEEFPNHPAAYRSRLKSAFACIELGKMEDAQRMLVDNLYNHSLTPRSPEWRDSLYALGESQYRQGMECEAQSRISGVDDRSEDRFAVGLAELEKAHGQFQEAIQNLSEAVRRFPEARQALIARYRIAESQRHSAKFARKRLTAVTIETTRVALHRQLQHDLTEAEAAYAQLLQQMDDDQQGEYRTPVEQALIRNCYFGRADALFDLARYEDAVDAYSAATNRYQTEPEALEAYVQIAACYRRLSRYDEARGTIEQARVVLQRIRPDAKFTQTTRLTRDQWVQYIDWLATL